MLGAKTGAQSPGTYFWALLVAAWLFAWATVTRLSETRFAGFAQWGFGLTIPALFGITVLFLWEAIVRGAGIPFVLLPPPSAIGAKFMASIPLLAADFNQTVLKAVLFGFVVGSFAGFLVAVSSSRLVPLYRPTGLGRWSHRRHTGSTPPRTTGPTPLSSEWGLTRCRHEPQLPRVQHHPSRRSPS